MADSSDDLLRKGNELLARARGHALTWAEDGVHRISPEGRRSARRRKARRQAAFLRLAKRLILSFAAVMAGMLALRVVVGPIGIEGLMAAVIALVLAWAAILFVSRPQEDTPERMAATDLAQLPQRTEDWLETQRPALPAPAQRQLDQIGLRLEAIQPQLATIDAREPAAIEVRRLLSDELPELVRGYRRVPEALRRQPLNGGATPDAQLVEGLETIEAEIGRMNAQLAAGDLHALATQQRFLEIKYRGDGIDEDEGRLKGP